MDKEEILINTQLALFFESPISRPDSFVVDFNKIMGNIFDQIPVILPVPNELSDVPVVQMNTTNGIYSCNIARGRVDFFHAGVGKEKFSNIKSDFQNESKKLYEFFSDKTKIKRIGFVTRFFFEDEKQDETIAKLINENFRKLHNGTTHQAYIRYVSNIKINEFEVNNFTSIEKFLARISEMGDNIKGILVTRDFNTNPEISYASSFDVLKINSLIKEAEERFLLEEIKKALRQIDLQ
ncbi:hypothetical protein GW934_02600 [Candidatus Falkowbacteria bacterium]|nr:hypothetical protein [Candidatus Falkowbacteria bacterium]